MEPLEKLLDRACFPPLQVQSMYFSIDFRAYFRFLDRRWKIPGYYKEAYSYLTRHIGIPENATVGQVLRAARGLYIDPTESGFVKMHDKKTGKEMSLKKRNELANTLVMLVLIQPFELYRADESRMRCTIEEKMERAGLPF